MHLRRMILCLFAALAPAFGAQGQVKVTSNFDTDADGWRVGDLYSVGGSSAPAWVSAGGVGGGFIRTADLYGWNAFWAPSKFLGDQSDMFGFTMFLSSRVVSSDGLPYPLVVMSNGSMTIQHVEGPPSPDNEWYDYVVHFVGSEWQTTGGGSVTDADVLSVLSSLSWLHVEADWKTGDDQVDLDRVCFYRAARVKKSIAYRDCEAGAGAVVPEPATAALLATGLLGLGFVARRKRA